MIVSIAPVMPIKQAAATRSDEKCIIKYIYVCVQIVKGFVNFCWSEQDAEGRTTVYSRWTVFVLLTELVPLTPGDSVDFLYIKIKKKNGRRGEEKRNEGMDSDCRE
jgi:hypothetical protein